MNTGIRAARSDIRINCRLGVDRADIASRMRFSGRFLCHAGACFNTEYGIGKLRRFVLDHCEKRLMPLQINRAVLVVVHDELAVFA